MILEAGEVHDQVAVCGEVLLMVGPSAEVQGGAGFCTVGQSFVTHVFPLMEPQHWQMKVSLLASFNFNYFLQDVQLLQLDCVYILCIPPWVSFNMNFEDLWITFVGWDI